MTNTGKIPATVITGFLGAGKTSAIRHLLANANGKRLALVINEFGDLGVDGEILKGCGIEGCAEDDVLELANGCICCTVADDFLPTMEALLDRADAAVVQRPLDRRDPLGRGAGYVENVVKRPDGLERDGNDRFAGSQILVQLQGIDKPEPVLPIGSVDHGVDIHTAHVGRDVPRPLLTEEVDVGGVPAFHQSLPQHLVLHQRVRRQSA